MMETGEREQLEEMEMTPKFKHYGAGSLSAVFNNHLRQEIVDHCSFVGTGCRMRMLQFLFY